MHTEIRIAVQRAETEMRVSLKDATETERIAKPNATTAVNSKRCEIRKRIRSFLSGITAVITEPGRQSCKQKNPHASPASRASHCYPAFQQWYSTSTPIIFECLVRSFANRSSHSRIAFDLDSHGSSISRQPCSDKSFQQPSGVMTAEGR